ncbi:MAG: hypothetical protein KDA58_16940 [Planctomycetaceae bacterium]|nr:hypothetical protein [Planctomycetaceae bacterium]
MTQDEIDAFVARSEAIYERRLRDQLEVAHRDDFVAIEPESGDYFLGKTLREATQAARKVHPGRMTHSIRIGHRAAIHLG